jgi:hypothetical protein
MSIYSSIDETIKSIFSDPGLDLPDPNEQSFCQKSDFVSGMIWITDGKESRYICENDAVPDGWNLGRTMNHMSKTNPEKWKAVTKSSAEKQWKFAKERKKQFSSRMRKTWEDNYETMAANARKNGKHGMFGKLSPHALLLEYKGVQYYGWRELKESTGVSKALYKKYYLNGIDPEPRIGKDGPAAK